ncbi:MAG: type II secretion system F family protein [Candidatus Micrarchaeota archaeon]
MMKEELKRSTPDRWTKELEQLAPLLWKKELEKIIDEADSGKKAEKIFATCAIAGIVLFFSVFLAAIVLPQAKTISIFYITGVSLAGFLAPFFFVFLFFWYRFEQRKREKESQSADVLLAASSLPTGAKAEELLLLASSDDFGLLGKEFETARRELDAGVSLEDSLIHVKQRCGSVSIGRMVDLLVVGVQSGADLSLVFRETAEDLLETQGLLEERQAALVIEKYTILVAGGIVVPLILGLVFGLVQKMDFELLSNLEIGLTSQTRKELLQFSNWGTLAYLAEYGVLAGIFVGLQEGNWKKGVLYALALVPLGLAVFGLAAGGG